MTGHQWLDVLIGIVLALFLIFLLVMAARVIRRPKEKTHELEAAYRRFSSSDASPAAAAQVTPVEPAVLEASPAPSGGVRPMAVRWGLGVVVGLLVLGAGVVSYRILPGSYTSASSPATTAGSAPATVPAETASPADVPSSAGLSAPSDSGRVSEEGQTIQVEGLTDSVKPFEAVRIDGRYPGGADTFLRVQRMEGGKWVAFPVPTKTDRSGHFTAYVEFGQPGRYRLRVLHPATGVASKPFVLVIKG